MTNEPTNPPVRTVHLLGGLRAYDVPGKGVEVGQDQLLTFKFANVPYGQLYRILAQFNLTPIGVDFINSYDQVTGTQPANFEMISTNGFTAMDTGREWSNVAHAYRKNSQFDVTSLASRISTYLKLLTRRLYQVSEAYYSMSRERRIVAAEREKVGDLGFNNLWTWELQTTIHGFLADAATLRDILAEAVWRLVMKNHDNDVLTMGKFIRVTKNNDDPFIQNFRGLGIENNWMKNLTDLRNETTHVVPVSDFHEVFQCYMREIAFRGERKILVMHCPLTTSDWKLRKGVVRDTNFAEDSRAKAALESYRKFVNDSGDALEYFWITVQNFADWAEKIRIEAKLSAKIPVVNMDDLIGTTINFNRSS